VYADDLLRPWFEALRGELEDLSVFDCHTHVGIHELIDAAATAEPETLTAAREAFDAPVTMVPIKQAAPGPVAAERVCAYPPGIPSVVHGARHAASIVEYLQLVSAYGAMVEAVVDQSLSQVRVVDA
jgi:arginine/lysine/ornithine decarboxylase